MAFGENGTGKLTPSAFVDLLLENIPDMNFVKDAQELRFVRFNRAGEQLIGQPRENLIGRSDHDIFPPEQADFFVSQDRKVLESGMRLDIAEEPISTARGVRTLHTKKIPVYDRDGKPAYLLGISEDITELKLAHEDRMRLEIERRNVRIRDEFISIASHELRTPLTPLKLQIQLLRKGLLGDDPVRQADLLRAAEAQVDRLTQLIEGLLDVSRISAGRMLPQRARVDLRDLVVSVVAKFRLPFEKAGCALEVHAAAAIAGDWDASQLERVVTNLLTNALKFGGGKPVRIELAETADARGAELRVRDQGLGIAPEDQARIFQRFERAVNEKNYGGLGLGLYICRELVEAHGGELRVESRPGEGACFIVRLPKAAAETERDSAVDTRLAEPIRAHDVDHAVNLAEPALDPLVGVEVTAKAEPDEYEHNPEKTDRPVAPLRLASLAAEEDGDLREY
jgi:PAS domain S-box-containing protein